MKTLVFTQVGTAILEDEDGSVLWSSDEDADFAETNPNEFLDDEDADVIGSYLVEKEVLDDDEEINVESDLDQDESLIGTDDDDEDDDDYDDDEDDDDE